MFMGEIEKGRFITNDSVAEKEKLERVQVALKYATTKVSIYAIEMYAQEKLEDWVKDEEKGVLAFIKEKEKLDKEKQNKIPFFKDLLKNRESLKNGEISLMDFSMNRMLIENYVIKKANEDFINKILDENVKKALDDQTEKERECLEKLRLDRNKYIGHDTETPSAKELIQWAIDILNYIEAMEARCALYAEFDEKQTGRKEPYSCKEGFYNCKVEAYKQIYVCYAKPSDFIYKFGAQPYDIIDFKKMIEAMAKDWETGIQSLIDTNEDNPELNLFFKNCLPEKKYDTYKEDRDALRDAVRQNSEDKDYLYFKLLYHANPSMENIYWRGKPYTREEFAKDILYNAFMVNDEKHFYFRLNKFEEYYHIDLKKWSELHILSEVYFVGKEDAKGQRWAREMEDAIFAIPEDLDFKKCQSAIGALSWLYFYMRKDNHGDSMEWPTVEYVRSYMENADHFKDGNGLRLFCRCLYWSSYYKEWIKRDKKQLDSWYNNEFKQEETQEGMDAALIEQLYKELGADVNKNSLSKGIVEKRTRRDDNDIIG